MEGILILYSAEPNPGPVEAYMLDKDASLARLEIIRQVAEKMRQEGRLARSLERARSLDFIANPRMPVSATWGELKEKEEEVEDLLTEVAGPTVKIEDDTEALIAEYGLKSRGYTGSGQKLEALWEARTALGLKPGEEVKLLQLAKLAASESHISLSAIRNFINRDMTPVQKIALKKGLRAGKATNAPEKLENPTSPCTTKGPPPALSYDDRLLALVRASVELRVGDANKIITIDELVVKAAPAMKFSMHSAKKFVEKLNREQKTLLGIAERKPAKG